ncbi:hypothetical protein KJS94_01160 [Flavihumibacter rivuli]|uniref:hypothetical protein n=1 Tax=Flavihumibacter rivuli TaxID=2838156 RepID=UPI001BDDE6DD|nr:hypothetical protein [Flavihumibacter rivuli]ULQ56804.1 hypothetical protein KJS94_01160 [Flavihumibacter rivuli]
MNALGKTWCRIALFNFFLLALVGLLLRVKIMASLPWLNYKHLLHAHSHFAFAGWVSLCLMGVLVGLLPIEQARKFQPLFVAQLISAVGMLSSFPFQGYGAVSIFFSTASVLVSYWFAFRMWRSAPATGLGEAALLSLKAALVFLVLSSLGTFYLAWLMANKIDHPQHYFGAVYFYLHFQYNGWFLFGILAILLSMVKSRVVAGLESSMLLMVVSAVPACALSALWMRLPAWLYVLAAVAGIVQLIGFALFLRALWSQWQWLKLEKPVRQVWLIAIAAMGIKFLLQAFSAIPFFSKFAFAYRPIVIGYLHLVLLGCISLFLVGWLMQVGLVALRQQRLPIAVGLLLAGIALTELTLMVQGIASISYTAFPLANPILLAAALLLVLATGALNFPHHRRGSHDE